MADAVRGRCAASLTDQPQPNSPRAASLSRIRGSQEHQTARTRPDAAANEPPKRAAPTRAIAAPTAPAPTMPTMPAPSTPILVYDGECGFCSRSARWMRRRLPASAQVQPLQALDLDAAGLTRQDALGAAWWIEGEGAHRRRYRGADAITRALTHAGGAWTVAGRIAASAPLRWPARAVYAVVARNRHRLRVRSSPQAGRALRPRR